LIGVTIGLLISIYFIIQNNFKAEYKIITNKKSSTDYHLIKLNSNVSFLNKVKLRKSLDEIQEYSVLTIDGTECNFIDYDILEIISEFEEKAKDRHIEVILNGIEKVSVSSLH
jgi:MFS superfamily sulfate permease-like transporter